MSTAHTEKGKEMTEETTELNALGELAEEWGHDAGAINAFIEISGEDIADVTQEQFEEAYQGEYDSAKDYAEEMLAEVYSELLEQKILWGVEIGAYVDYESIARDLDYNGMHFEDSGHYTVYVFDF